MGRMVYCGSGLFQVAFSSVAIFSAIYSRIFLKTLITPLQWVGIVVVTMGLVVSPLSSSAKGGSPVVGILLTLLGAQFYAISYIVNEYISVSVECDYIRRTINNDHENHSFPLVFIINWNGHLSLTNSVFLEIKDRKRFASVLALSIQLFAWLLFLSIPVCEEEDESLFTICLSSFLFQ